MPKKFAEIFEEAKEKYKAIYDLEENENKGKINLGQRKTKPIDEEEDSSN